MYNNGGVVCDGIVKVPQRRMERGHNFELSSCCNQGCGCPQAHLL